MKKYCSPYRTVGTNTEAVFIVDRGEQNARAISDSFEFVALNLISIHGPKRIVYRDRKGEWREICHDDGRFTMERALSDFERRRWQEWLVATGEEPWNTREWEPESYSEGYEAGYYNDLHLNPYDKERQPADFDAFERGFRRGQWDWARLNKK